MSSSSNSNRPRAGVRIGGSGHQEQVNLKFDVRHLGYIVDRRLKFESLKVGIEIVGYHKAKL